MFTARPDYYGLGIVDGTAISKDYIYYTKRWPQREYQLTNISEIQRDPADGKLFVRYELKYRVANASKTVTGEAQYAVLIDDIEGSPKVAAIKEWVTNRHMNVRK